MSEIKLTQSQQEFVNSFDKNTLVSASAGSGKTSTMIVKLTDMIVNKKIPVKNLLIVTYTNSAGSEMKQKLFNSLIKSMQDATSDDTIEFIGEQIDDMVNCDIGTLHGICKKIITSYFYVVGQDPTFSLLNEQQSDYFYNLAMDKVFNNLIASNDEDFYYVYSLYNKKRNLNNLKYVVKTLYNYLLSKVDSLQWKNFVINESIDVSKEYLLTYFKNYLVSFEESLKMLKQKCDYLFNDYTDFVGDRLNFLIAVNGLTDYDKMFQFVNNYEFVKKPRKVQSKMSAEEIDFVDEMEVVVSEFVETIKNFKQNFILMDGNECAQYVRLVNNLFNIVDMVKSEYETYKKQQNALDFSDLEHITLEILENEQVVNTLKEKYKYIFVDEYQDINQVQETIISKIKRDNNLYMIGDVKQSIYAFRLSSPEIFINKYNKFMVETGINKVVNLNENFRSRENILEFSNLIFNKLITDNTIGINYEKSAQLVAGLGEDFEKSVELNIINSENEISEAHVIAVKVGELIKKGYDFKDIAILLRSKGELVNNIVDEFKKYNIPIEATYKTELFRNSEVLVLYYLMKLVNNMNDDVAMATVLKSLFVKLTDNELAEIRLINNDGMFYECVYEYMQNGTNDHIKQKLNDFYQLIKEIRFDLNNYTITEVLNSIINKFNFINYYLSFVDGFEKVGNIEEFLRIVSNDEYKYDLQKCIDYLATIKENGEVNLTLASVGNSVKIMTIHSSKGLEYPAVILGGVGKKFVLNKQTEDIIINDKLGVGIKQFDILSHTQKDSIVKNACKIKNKKGEIDEEIRLLYVALTRAKKHLCIVGEYDLKNVRQISQKNVYSSRSYLDLMIKAVPENFVHYFENLTPKFQVNDNEKSVFDVNIINELDDEFSGMEREMILNAVDKQTIKKIAKYLDYNYPYYSNKNIAIKNSVSQVLKEEVDYEKHIDSLSNNSQQNDAALKLGTAYHNIMQNLNYTENKAEIEDIISRIKTPDLPYGLINIDDIVVAINKVKSLMDDNCKILKEAQFVMKVNYGKLLNIKDDVDVIIQGVIDLVIINNNDAIIIDFKTNKTHDKEYLKNQYGLQLKMYAEAFEKAYKVKVNKKLLFSFEMGELIEV